MFAFLFKSSKLEVGVFFLSFEIHKGVTEKNDFPWH